MFNHYILDGHTVIPEPDFNVWGLWFHTADRLVAFDEVMYGVELSTFFIGIGPTVFETALILDGDFYLLNRWETWEAAEQGHARYLRVYKRVCPWCGHLRDWQLACQHCKVPFVPFNRYQFLPFPGGTRVFVCP